MSATRAEISQLLESLAEEDLDVVKDFVNVLLQEPDPITANEMKELEKGEQEIQQGKWVMWKELKTSSNIEK